MGKIGRRNGVLGVLHAGENCAGEASEVGHSWGENFEGERDEWVLVGTNRKRGSSSYFFLFPEN